VAQADEVQPTDHTSLVGPERERVADQHPQNRYERKGDERLHDRADDVLRPHEPPVEEGQSGRHEHHEGGGGEEPGGVATVDVGHGTPSCPVHQRA
jgi:hypothetical protein